MLFIRVTWLGEKSPTRLLLAAVSSLKFGFGTLLLFESLMTILGFWATNKKWILDDFGQLFASVCRRLEKNLANLLFIPNSVIKIASNPIPKVMHVPRSTVLSSWNTNSTKTSLVCALVNLGVWWSIKFYLPAVKNLLDIKHPRVFKYAECINCWAI